MIMVNFTAPILLTKKLLHLLKTGSTVVFIITAGVQCINGVSTTIWCQQGRSTLRCKGVEKRS
jgi:short-subunit dehydrogenase involved in D-alanine esterification of teichoic acids